MLKTHSLCEDRSSCKAVTASWKNPVQKDSTRRKRGSVKGAELYKTSCLANADAHAT